MKPFELLVWGIVAILLIFGVINLFNLFNFEEDITQEIKTGLKLAQTNDLLGHTIKLKTRELPKGTFLTKKTFEEERTSFAFECNNPKLCCIRLAEKDKNDICINPVDWDYDKVLFNNLVTIKNSVRCIIVEKVPVCRVYLGSYPAQAKVLDIEYNKGNPSSTMKIRVKNEGETNLVNGEIELVLQKKVEHEWKNTENQFPLQQISLLTPGQTHEFIFTIEIGTTGYYRALYKFGSQNSGYDTNNFDFNILTNEGCKANTNEYPQTMYWDENYNAEIRTCTNCNYAYECATVWQNIHPRVNYEIMTKEKTYCLKISEGATCSLEAGYDE